MNTDIEFDTISEALKWLVRKTRCDIENQRFAFQDNVDEMKIYHEKRSQGCLCSFDYEVLVGGKPAMVGCHRKHKDESDYFYNKVMTALGKKCKR